MSCSHLKAELLAEEASRRTPVNRGLLYLISVLTCFTACSRTVELPQGLEDSDVDSSAKRQDAVCSLLTGSEVEIALNAPLEAASPKPRAILVGMTMCGLSTADPYSAASWGVLLKKGSSPFESYGKWNEAYIRPVRGIGEDAVWDEKLGTLLVSRSDMVVGVRLSVKDPPVSTKSERRLYAEQTAKRLAAKLLRRL